MRKTVKICGELFDIDQVEGGKLRASSIKLPGFELIEATHNLLRMRMQKALAQYDREQLLKPGNSGAAQGVPFGLNPAPCPLNVFVHDHGAQHAIPCSLTQVIGVPAPISEYGIEYKIIRYRSNALGSLLAVLEKELLIARQLGATDIVWRTTPEITFDSASYQQINARLHFLPQHVNANINWLPNGAAAPII